MIQLLSNIALMGVMQIVVLGGFLLGMYYFTFYDDGTYLRKKTAEVQTQVKIADQKIQKQKEEVARLVNFQKSLEREARAIKYFLSYIPNEYTVIDVFHFLTQEAKSAGINIEDKSDRGVEDGDIYDALKVNVKVAGSFSQVLLFLSRLTAQKKILVVKEINFTLVNSEGNQKRITANMTVYAYRYKEQKPDEEKKEG